MIVILFVLYIKIFDKNISSNIANIIYKADKTITTWQTTSTTWEQSPILQKLDMIDNHIDSISDGIDNLMLEKTPDIDHKQDILVTKPTTIKLYYFNQIEDQKLDIAQQINTKSILPIDRTISETPSLIQDTINLLLKWELTDDEIKNWFMTEFPNKYFRLIDLNLDKKWNLTLEFSEVPWFTDWWSARMLILSNSIIKTASQFAEVKNINIIPETLFQP